MKYIIMKITFAHPENATQNRPYIFSKEDVHAEVKTFMTHKLMREENVVKVECIAAGFVALGDIVCVGESESIGIKSRGKEDEKAILETDPSYRRTSN